MPPAPASRLATAALLVVSLWAALVGLTGLLMVTAAAGSIGSFLASVFVFVTGLNAWFAGLIVGIVALATSGRAPRIAVWVVLQVALVAGSVVAFGLSTGDDETGTRDLGARGAALVLLALLAVVASAVCLGLRPRPDRTGLTAAAAGLVLLGGLLGAAWIGARPSIRLHNDTDERITVEYCPAQVCSGDHRELGPGESVRLEREESDALDIIRVAPRGCFLVGGGPEDAVGTYRLDVSDAEPGIC